MRVSTKSVLFGAHSVIHPFYVGIAWARLYGFPWDLRLWLAFGVHDIGYWSRSDVEGPEGERHVELGARIVTRLFGPEWDDLCSGHSRHWGEALWKAGLSAMLRGQAGVRADAGLALTAHDPRDRRVAQVHGEIP